MKIGRFVRNSEGALEEVVESTSYPNWAEAQAAADILFEQNADNENVFGIFLATETSPDTYIIRSIID